MVEPNPTPVLELETITPQRHISIDGVAYRMAKAGSLNMVQANRVRRLFLLARRSLEEDQTLSDEEAAAFDAGLEQAMHDILPGLPEDVLATLDMDMRTAVVLTYSARPAEGEVPPTTSNGAQSSRRGRQPK